jgi:hypothetical protein
MPQNVPLCSPRGRDAVDHQNMHIGGGLSHERCFRQSWLVGLGSREPVAEGDGEGVQGGLPSHRGLSLVAFTVRDNICWTGAGSSGVARSAGHYEKCMEGSVHQGRRRVHGPAMPVVCLSIPGCAGGCGWVVPASSFPAPVHPVAGTLLPAGLANCTGLYVAVRGIGGTGARAHVHIDDSVWAERAVRNTAPFAI